ncbi:MAG: 23S rRNA (adenine(2503)-C(2))-methyltransferase RlmN [Candidatus Omnitrophica bacterium]|nr:23S rRNA (adenine(2503)-C(2))-methyltransferase RlmN [Candidatus Omnitrophota bacterium]
MRCCSTTKKDIKDLTLDEFSTYLKSVGEKSFRAQQIFKWIYDKKVDSFDAMRNVSSDLKEKLSQDFTFSIFSPYKKQISKDQTAKFLFEVGANQYVESVLIPAKGRLTLCISTQVGCKFGCLFCASGKNGWLRNLSCSEILNQILSAQKHDLSKKITHIVFMGIGEPFDNYDNVLKAIRIINDPKGFGIAARRITVSTCGLIPEIKKFSQEGLQIELAISLHASDNKIRNRLMPVNKKYPLEKLLKTCQEYVQKTKRQITFEYVLIKELNASHRDAENLASLLKGMLCKVNLIAYNQIDIPGCSAMGRDDIFRFKKILEDRKILVTTRLARGQDISAACGQLRYVNTEKN